MIASLFPNTCATRTRSAAPAGGARFRGRGCVWGLIFIATPGWAETSIDVPSGQQVSLSEILLDENPGELWVRFRFLTPQIARGPEAISPESAAMDMQALCNDIAAPYLAENAIEPARIVVSFSDRDVPFGQSDPTATQFFELFSVQNGVCIWEEF